MLPHLHKFQTALIAIFVLASSLQLGCGSSDPHVILVNFSAGTGVTNGDPNADPFLDATVADVVVLISNLQTPADVTDSSGNVVIAAGTLLDENGDSVPDQLIFPSTCDVNLAAGCGIPNSSASFDITGLPLNYTYNLTMQFRDTSRNLVYQGTAGPFNNIESLTTLTITVVKI